MVEGWWAVENVVKAIMPFKSTFFKLPIELTFNARDYTVINVDFRASGWVISLTPDGKVWRVEKTIMGIQAYSYFDNIYLEFDRVIKEFNDLKEEVHD